MNTAAATLNQVFRYSGTILALPISRVSIAASMVSTNRLFFSLRGQFAFRNPAIPFGRLLLFFPGSSAEPVDKLLVFLFRMAVRQIVLRSPG